MSSMSHRLTKEELDAQFEQFLKESVSDDSLDVGGPDKQWLSKPSQRSAPEATAPWWQDDLCSSEETERAEAIKHRFLKAKKSQQEEIEGFQVGRSIGSAPSRMVLLTSDADVNVENLDKPVPKPGRRASDEPAQLLPTHSDWSSESRIASSAQSDGSCQQGDRSPGRTGGSPPAGSERCPDGLSGLGKSFRESLRKTPPIREEDEAPGDSSLSDEAALLTRETDDSAVKRSSVGLDTLEEEEEKARFFSQLEAGASSTIDYSKLNRELDSTGSTNLRRAEEQSDEAGVPESSRASPGSPHYSEDFVEEATVKEEKPKMSSILARVCFYDSLDETGGEDRGKDTAASVDKGPLLVQSGASEMEALQEAYQQIHVAEASEDERETIRRAAWSPPHSQCSLLPASTNQSDLPTAEELMKPIRPEDASVRGFSLRLLRSAAHNQDETPRPFGKTFTGVTRSESRLTEPPGHADLSARIHGTGGGTGHRSTSPDPHSRDLTWSIRQEVERLMQEQSASQTSSLIDRAKKQAATASRPSSTSARKASAAPVRGRTMDKKPAAPARAAAPLKHQSPVSSRVQQPPPRAKPSPSRETQQGADADVRASSELVASVQSLVSVLQQQIGAVHPRDVVEELSVQLALKEEELQRRTGGAEEELQVLRQQNYLLQSQLGAADAARQKLRLQAADPATQQKIQQMDREMKEQETLIRGYQQENEKLYVQMKAQQASSKSTEEAMFEENQRLLSDLASTREQLKKRCRPAGSLYHMDHTRRMTELLAQIETLQRSEAALSEERRSLKVENRALEVELQLVKKERALAQVQTASGDRSSEIQALELKHGEEVEALKKKLQWFTENQELLDRDAGRLKAATAEVLLLREQVEKLKEDVGRRNGEQQRKSRVRSVETKRLQELQSQVKQLELILRSRNPTSLPALIYAAASAGEEAGGARITVLLERRIQRLEAELESHDEEAKRSLRSMEQQFDRIKLRYEQQISELEQKLQQEQAAAAAGLELEWWASKLQAAEEKLQLEQQNHQEKEKALREQVESLQQQLRLKAPSSPSRYQRQADEALASRLERQNHELSAKTRSVQELQRTVERLQRERRNILSRPHRPPSHPTAAPHGSFPSTQYEKTYQPTVFTGSHISEVLQEKEALQQHVELQQLQLQQDKEARQAEAQQAEEARCRVKELFTQQISSMKAEHLRALERLRNSHALQHSSSRVAELSNQLGTQEIAIQHLQEQLVELRGVQEALVLSRTREEALQEQVSRLLQQLKEATDAQSPEVKLLCGLEKKMVSMELRHQQREQQLQQVMGGSLQTVAGQSEVERWRLVAQEKSRQMEAFRLELDSILDILRHLQRQGGVLHGPQSVPQRS